MIDWNKYFDHIFVISRCKNFDRREKLNKEFERLGLTDYIQYMYQPDSEKLNYDKIWLEDNKSAYRCAYGHYSTIKMAYELNYDNILILEDDIVFLKDIDKIQSLLDIFKDDNSDIYLFDYEFNKYDQTIIYRAGGYYLNRHGMEYIIYMLEKYNFLQADQIFITVLSNCMYFLCDYFYFNKQTQHIEIPEEANILPIIIHTCPEHMIAQYIEFESQNLNKTDYDIT